MNSNIKIASIADASQPRKTAIIVGALFLIGWITGFIAAILASPILTAPDYLIKVSAHDVSNF